MATLRVASVGRGCRSPGACRDARLRGLQRCRGRGGTKAGAAAALQATAAGTRGRTEMREEMREEQRAEQSKGGEN